MTLGQYICHRARSCVPKARYDVAVDFECDSSRRMSEHHAQDFGVYALREKQPRTGVPQVSGQSLKYTMYTTGTPPKEFGPLLLVVKRGVWVPFVAPLCSKGLRLVTVRLPEKSSPIGPGLNRTLL